MAHFYLQGLLLLVSFMVISPHRDVSPHMTVTASQEEDVALPCFNPNGMDPKSCYRVKWMKFATDPHQMKVILARPETPKIPDAGRVKWEADGNGQMSLCVTKLRKSDEGMYSCEIWQGWDCILVKNISLQVNECKGLQAVKVAPGTTVTLTCPVDLTSGQRPQNISWVMQKGASTETVNSERVEINGTSFSIQSVDYNDRGWYKCKYMLEETWRCFDMNLLVQEEIAVVATTIPALTSTEIFLGTSTQAGSGALIAVVASVIIAVALIAALIGLFMYCRFNTQRAAQQTQIRPAAGTHTECLYAYETVNLTPSEDTAHSQVNNLYQPIEDEHLCTFQR